MTVLYRVSTVPSFRAGDTHLSVCVGPHWVVPQKRTTGQPFGNHCRETFWLFFSLLTIEDADYRGCLQCHGVRCGGVRPLRCLAPVS